MCPRNASFCLLTIKGLEDELKCKCVHLPNQPKFSSAILNTEIEGKEAKEQQSGQLPKLVVPQSTWNTNHPVYLFYMFSAVFPLCFPQWCLGSEMQRVYVGSGCLGWVWGCKGDICSRGHLAALSDCLGPLFLSCSGITCWDLLMAAKFQVWADVQILPDVLCISISTALLFWGRCGPCPQETFSHEFTVPGSHNSQYYCKCQEDKKDSQDS